MSDELLPIEEGYQTEFDTIRKAAESISLVGMKAAEALRLTGELLVTSALRIPSEYFNRDSLLILGIRASEPTPKIGAGSEGVGDE